MSNEPFHASKLKVKQAEHHIADLNLVLTAFIAKHPYVVVGKQDSSGTDNIIQVDQTEPFPCEVPLIIGDAIHNLRSSLDLMACDLVLLSNGNIENVYFPFAESATDLEKAIKDRRINRATPDVVDLIRRLKPYRGGNKLLRAIHDLDINDKHRLIIPILEYAVVQDTTIRLSGNNIIKIGTIVTQPGNKGMNLVKYPSDWYAQIEHHGETSVHINFGKGQPLEGEHIVSSLYQMISEIQGIIEMFEVHCLRQKQS